MVQLGETQVKIQGVEEIGDLVQGNTARLLRVTGRSKPFCRRGKSRCFFFFLIILHGEDGFG